MQKFFRGQKVKITSEVPSYMKHFDAGIEAIVEYSYSDVYGEESSYSYSLLLLGNFIHSASWYDEYLLTLVDDNRRKGERMLQEYKERTCKKDRISTEKDIVTTRLNAICDHLEEIGEETNLLNIEKDELIKRLKEVKRKEDADNES